MKIVMAAPIYSTHTFRWCRGLHRRGHTVHLISNSHEGETAPGVEVTLLPGTSSLAYMLNVPRFKKAVALLKPDLVHAHYATGFALWGSMQKTAPLVVSAWGSDIEDAITRPGSVGRITRKALHAAAAITTTSDFLRQRTLEFDDSISGKIETVYFGVDIPDESKMKKTGDEDVVKFVFAKPYTEFYAPDLALRSFATAFKANPKIRLHMMGRGPLLDDLKRMVGELRLGEAVTIDGWLEYERTQEIIRSSDIMLMPSRKESFGVAAAEAAASGIPVIATNVGGIPEIIKHEKNGILIKPDDDAALSDAILKLAGNPELRRQYGAAGRRIAIDKFDFNKSLDKMEALYVRVGGGK